MDGGGLFKVVWVFFLYSEESSSGTLHPLARPSGSMPLMILGYLYKPEVFVSDQHNTSIIIQCPNTSEIQV